MGPPGGGRNNITNRFTRHLNIVSIESFDDSTMTKIFSSLVDWHFSKGFDAVFSRLGKVKKYTENTCSTEKNAGLFLTTSAYEFDVHVTFSLSNHR